MRRLLAGCSILRWSIYYEGGAFTLLRVALKILQRCGFKGTDSAWFQERAERRYDRRFNVQTAGSLFPHQLDLPQDRLEHAVEYCSTAVPRFGWLLSKLPIRFDEYEFVDYGSGKGRALLMASEFPFKRIVGVELAKGLHEIAIRNIHTFTSARRKCQHIECICQDAVSFELPHEPLVLYFFNPFSEMILGRVIDRLEASLLARPRHVIVIYFNSRHQGVFNSSAIFTEITDEFDLTPGWAIYETHRQHAFPCGQSKQKTHAV